MAALWVGAVGAAERRGSCLVRSPYTIAEVVEVEVAIVVQGLLGQAVGQAVG